MRIFQRSLLFLALLGFPSAVFAAIPSNVTGIRAWRDGANIQVTWTKLSEDSIASYNVCYSFSSILAEDGLYDDCIVVPGTNSNSVLTGVPSTGTIYVSVLAVDQDGEESAFFVEEASVSLAGGASSSSSSQRSSSSAARSSVSSKAKSSAARSASSARVSSAAPVSTAEMALRRQERADQRKTQRVVVQSSSAPAQRQPERHLSAPIRLPQTGMEALVLISLSGGAIGWMFTRKRGQAK